MPDSNRTTAGQPTPSWWQLAFGFLIYIVVQPARSLWHHIEGIDGVITVLLAIPATLFLVIFPLGSWLADSGLHWWSRTLLSSLGGAIFYIYATPAIWRWLLHPAVELSEAVVDRVRNLLSKYTMKVCGGLLTGIRSGAPLSSRLWAPLLDAKRSTTFIKGAVGAIAVCAILAGSLYLAGLTFLSVHGLAVQYLTVGDIAWWLAIVLAFVATAVVILVTAGIGFSLLEFGELPFIAELSGAAFVYGGCSYVQAATGAAWWLWVGCVVAYLVWVAYLFPGAIRLLSGKFWEKIFTKLGDIINETYSEPRSAFRYFAHHLMTAIFSAAIGCAAFALGSALGLSWYCTVTLGVVSGVSAYGLIFKATDHSVGNLLYALTIALMAAYATDKIYVASGLPFHGFGALTAAAVTGLAVLLVILPPLYIGFKRAVFAVGKLGLEAPVSAAFTRVNAQYLKAQKSMQDIEDAAYREYDDTAYRRQFLHLGNLAVAGCAWWMADIAVAHFGFSHGWSLVAQILAPVVSYLFIGRLILKSGFGAAFVSIVLGGLLGVFVGSTVWALGTGVEWQIASGVAMALTWAAFVLEYFPPLYEGLRRATESWTVKWLGPALAYVYAKLWAPVDWFYRGIEAGFEWIATLLAPVWTRVASWFAAAAKAYNDFLDMIRGRR